MRVRVDQHWTCSHKHTPSVKCTLTWISTDLACTVMHRTSSIVPELRVQRLRSVQIVTFASRQAINLLYMNGSFSNISAVAVHVLTSRTFCTCSLPTQEWSTSRCFLPWVSKRKRTNGRNSKERGSSWIHTKRAVFQTLPRGLGAPESSASWRHRGHFVVTALQMEPAPI